MGLSGHKRINQAAIVAYGRKSDLSDEEILEELLSLNLQRARDEQIKTLSQNQRNS